VTRAVPAIDGLSVSVTLEKLIEDHIYEFDLTNVRSHEDRRLVHSNAYYTVNEIPKP
jgi:hypothetical protein